MLSQPFPIQPDLQLSPTLHQNWCSKSRERYKLDFAVIRPIVSHWNLLSTSHLVREMIDLHRNNSIILIFLFHNVLLIIL